MELSDDRLGGAVHFPRSDGEAEQPSILIPRPAQAIALKELNRTLDEGYDRAMAVLPTGLGKTYLAAFFAQQFKRVLFIAHREELLHQARRSFLQVMPDRMDGKDIYALCDGNVAFEMHFIEAIERGPNHWHQPMSPQEAAPFFHSYLMEKEYRKRIDFSDKKSRGLWAYDRNKTAALIAEMSMMLHESFSITGRRKLFTIVYMRILNERMFKRLTHMSDIILF